MRQGHVQLEREVSGRWRAEVPSISGSILHGATLEDAVAAVRGLAVA